MALVKLQWLRNPRKAYIGANIFFFFFLWHLSFRGGAAFFDVGSWRLASSDSNYL